jgi:predicted amidohydrolase YtcJ
MPGMWDLHSHAVMFGRASLKLYLALGVTGIRDMGAERFADARHGVTVLPRGYCLDRACGSRRPSSRTRAGSRW